MTTPPEEPRIGRRLEFPILEALPRVAELSAHPVTAALCAAALAVAIASFFGLDPVALEFDVRFLVQPWRLVTSVLPHIGVVHLAFNLYWLWCFGTVVEEMLGRWRYLAMIVAVAIGSAAAEHALVLGGVGLSGIVYALFGFLWINRGASDTTLVLMSRSTIGLFVIWFFVCIALTAARIWAFGNVAHALGAVLGVSIGGMRAASRWQRRALLLGMGLIVVAAVAAAAFRPYVNVASVHAAAIDGARGYALLATGRNVEAAMLLNEAVNLDGTVRTNWMNLGIALQRIGYATPALDAYEHALALAPGDPQSRRAIAALYDSLGRAAQADGRHEEAVGLLRRAVELHGEDP